VTGKIKLMAMKTTTILIFLATRRHAFDPKQTRWFFEVNCNWLGAKPPVQVTEEQAERAQGSDAVLLRQPPARSIKR
jgi:hypothetical protein